MSEATKLLQAIEQLKEKFNTPQSHMDIVRYAVTSQAASLNKPEMPEILDEEQRKVFMDRINMLEGFLKSPNGADAIELLVNAFETYCESVETQAE